MLESDFVYITRAGIALDYFGFLRLPYRIRKIFKEMAEQYYKYYKQLKKRK